MDEIHEASKRLKTEHETFNAEYQQFMDRLDKEEAKIEKRYGLLEEKQKSLAEARGNPNASADDLIEINAGGKIIAAKRSTLTHLKGTRLEALFSGCWDKKLLRDGDGRVFLDVNSEAFQSIVDYLNEIAISSPDNPPQHPTADCENQYIIDQLLELFTMEQLNGIDSNIVKTYAHIALLHDWLGEDGSDGDFDLLYRSTRDGQSALDFHSRCDNKGCTLTIVETIDGLIVGGYSNTPWNTEDQPSAFGWRGADKAFLFELDEDALSGNGISSPRKMKLRDPDSHAATFHNPNFGPSFGCGFDLKVVGSRLLLFPGSYEMEPLGEIRQRQTRTIKEVEVFQVNADPALIYRKTARREEHTQGATRMKIQEATSFTGGINDALNVKLRKIKEAEQKLTDLENLLDGEEKFIDLFASGETKDIVRLNVSGTTMSTKRSTLMVFEESVLARQFDDSKWTEQGHATHRVKEWTPGDVCLWAQSIEDVSDDVANIFEENQITGNELLVLEKDGLMMIGIKRAGTLCLLVNEIKKLQKASQNAITLIEHSPYCFGKFLDYLRLKKLHSNLVDEPCLPVIRESESCRFEKVVKYFFPGESAELILGRGMPITIKMALNALEDLNNSDNLSLKDGRPLHTIMLVAAVRSHELRQTAFYLDVEDGTGFVSVRVRLDEENDCIAKNQVCKDHAYIRIIGHVKQSDGRMQILATNVRPVRSGNELTNHFREVAICYEKHIKKVGSRGDRSGLRGGSPLNDAMLYFIKTLGSHNIDIGVHVSDVVAQVNLFQQLATRAQREQVSSQVFSADDIRNALNHLSNEGLIYSTIDEHHYQM
mmetsp:Transcript_43337/g.77884  ORF Transcript_43337/g.77884 Transcript_43337/m.77884 type:complete len:825 (+) Transcript_43337:202-2676(+)|eukprot:CAMPEP_0201922504 /NCGR_PEP_ID=MMETSP0903-20130614/10520_1 /ASSEMBLY_ACC=CAM_ASM_000552 /TAXON_ID=420261 /ORGANISM="Thalassiosira antarctica, Strain CCMP982" /LENGTH=824 /DNA_ID=CAMNT_0048459661 /DNA_START=167 /DNA_END=2641 /DNA_ORIENTATION=+